MDKQTPQGWEMRLVSLMACAGAVGVMLVARSARGNIAFNVTADAGTPQYVIDAFGLATARWSAALGDDVTVNINLGWEILPAGTLGESSYSYVDEDYPVVVTALQASASSSDDQSTYAHLQGGGSYSRLINHTSDNPNGMNSGTPYVNSLTPVAMTRANAKALGLLAASAQSDAAIHFNANGAFDLDPADGTSSGQFDFVSVAAHELGHALGFASVVPSIELGPWHASALPATILDLFRYSAESLAAGPGYIDNTADGRNKYLSVDGGVSTLAPLATGVVYGTGYHADHWREFTFAGLMDPMSFPGMQRQIGARDLRAMDVIGYRLPEPGTEALLVLGWLCVARKTRRRAG